MRLFNRKGIFQDASPNRGSFSRLAVILAALVWLCAFAPGAWAAVGDTVDDAASGLKYEVTFYYSGPPSFLGHVQVVNNSYNLSTYTIPYTVDHNSEDYLVTAISDNAFNGSTNLTSITLPDGTLRTIGDGAFVGCTGLTSITLPNTVETIGQNAFAGCTGLTSVTLSNTLETIGDGAFQNCSALTSITLPDTLEAIGDNAFNGCAGLTSITIPASVRNIGFQAFASCTSLAYVTFLGDAPIFADSDNVFNYSVNLTNIIVPYGKIDEYTNRLATSQPGGLVLNITDVVTPTATPAGGVYTTAQSVTLSTTTAGAAIYYTLDGATPTQSSTLYTGTITVQMGTTLKAIAALNSASSAVMTETYEEGVSTPYASPAGGTYTTAQSVRLYSRTVNAKIYYTLDGTTPTTSSTLYNGAISMPLPTTGTTIKAIAALSGYNDSAVMSETYIVSASGQPDGPPVITTDKTLPGGIKSSAYKTTLSATGTAPITWAWVATSGALPDGISLDRTTGTLSGTPTSKGIYQFKVAATNSAGSDEKEFTTVITEPDTDNDSSCGGNIGVGTAVMFFVSLGVILAPRLRRRKK